MTDKGEIRREINVNYGKKPKQKIISTGFEQHSLLLVDRAPRIVFPVVNEIYGRPGEKFQIDCKAIGEPKLDIYIETPTTTSNDPNRQTVAALLTPLQTNVYKFCLILLNFQNFLKFQEKENSVSIYIGKLSENNLGIYRCHARNAYGTVYKDIHVKFAPDSLVSPEIRIEPNIFDLFENDPLTVKIILTVSHFFSISLFQHCYKKKYFC